MGNASLHPRIPSMGSMRAGKSPVKPSGTVSKTHHSTTQKSNPRVIWADLGFPLIVMDASRIPGIGGNSRSARKIKGPKVEAIVLAFSFKEKHLL